MNMVELKVREESVALEGLNDAVDAIRWQPARFSRRCNEEPRDLPVGGPTSMASATVWGSCPPSRQYRGGTGFHVSRIR